MPTSGPIKGQTGALAVGIARNREGRIDIPADAGGHMPRNRLPPYPNMTGLGAIDCRIADAARRISDLAAAAAGMAGQDRCRQQRLSCLTARKS